MITESRIRKWINRVKNIPDRFDAELIGIYSTCGDKNENNRKKSSKLKSAEVASLYTLRWRVSLNIVDSKSCNPVLLFLKCYEWVFTYLMGHCVKIYQYFFFVQRSWNTVYFVCTHKFISKVTFTYIFAVFQFLCVKKMV